MSQDKLTSTGRRPSLDVSGIQALLERYMDGSNVSIATLAEEQSLTTATVRKYLKAAGLTLPRGRAALQTREVVSVRTLMNRMSVRDLIGAGRSELLRRRLEAGDSMTACASAFGISRDRVRRFRDECGLGPAESPAPEASESTPTEEEAQVAESVAQAQDLPQVAEAAPEASEEETTSEA